MRWRSRSPYACACWSAAVAISSSARTTHRCDRNGSRATSACSRPSREATSTTPPSSGRRNDAAMVTRPELQQRRDGLQPALVVVVAGHHHDVGAGAGQGEQRAVDDLLALGRGRRGVEQVAGHEHGVDLLGRGDRGDLGQHGAVLVGPAAAPHRLADVPVAGVQELHGRPVERIVGSGSPAGPRSPAGRRRPRWPGWPRPGTGTRPRAAPAARAAPRASSPA